MHNPAARAGSTLNPMHYEIYALLLFFFFWRSERSGSQLGWPHTPYASLRGGPPQCNQFATEEMLFVAHL